MSNTENTIIDRRKVSERAKLSIATIWREQQAGRFPPYMKLSARRVGLRASDLEAWLNGRRDWSEEAK